MEDRKCSTCLNPKPLDAFEPGRTVCKKCRRKQRNGKKREELKQLRQKVEQFKIEESFNGNSGVVTSTSDQIKSLDDLLLASKVDLTLWQVADHKVSSWNSFRSVGEDAVLIVPLFRVEARLQKRVLDAVEFTPVRPVELIVPTPKPRLKQTRNDFKLAVILPDSQNGWIRDYKTGILTPMHDPRCWDIALQLCDDLQPDTIVMLGDMVDAGELSLKFPSPPEIKFTLQKTIDDLAITLAQLRYNCPNTDIKFIEGNHELRLEKAIMNNFISAHGLTQANADPGTYPVMSFPYLLNLEKLGIDYIGTYPDGEVWLNEHLVCVHGDLVRSGGGNTSKAYLKKYNASVVCGHIHRQEQICETTWVRGKPVKRVAASPGTMCKLDGSVPSVNKRMDWQQGLMVVHYNEDEFYMDMIAINDGRTYYQGVLYQGSYEVFQSNAA
jgi:hypothetical protein